MIGLTKVPLTPISTAVILILLFFCIGESSGLSCYKCGQYNDGVGSITPCINSTAQMHLQDCPSSAKWCIKYVSEGSTVRDCVNSCVEKEVWSTRTYCCQNDGCNRGGSSLNPTTTTTTLLMTSIGILLVVVAGRLQRG